MWCNMTKEELVDMLANHSLETIDAMELAKWWRDEQVAKLRLMTIDELHQEAIDRELFDSKK